MGLYIFFLNIGPTLGSIISGFVVQALGWRWHLWVRLLKIFLIVAYRYHRWD
jgi:MFS family permease